MDRSDLQHLAEKERASWKPIRVHCCTASGCLAAKASGVHQALKQAADGNTQPFKGRCISRSKA